MLRTIHQESDLAKVQTENRYGGIGKGGERVHQEAIPPKRDQEIALHCFPRVGDLNNGNMGEVFLHCLSRSNTGDRHAER